MSSPADAPLSQRTVRAGLWTVGARLSSRVFDLVDHAQTPHQPKNAIWALVNAEPNPARLAARLGQLDADPVLLAAVIELVTARI